MKILLDKNKNFYKGNMHCHSTLSDGKLSPFELKEKYKNNGNNFLAITDHEFVKSHSYLDDEEFLTITSSEYAIKEFPNQSTLVNFNMKVCHLNIYAKKQDNEYSVCYNSVLDHYSKGEHRENINRDKDEYQRVYGKDGINELIRKINEAGFFVAYNHPRWSLENYGDYSGYEGLWGVEVFNTSCDRGGIYEYNINVLDDFLRDGKRVFATSGDDNHNQKRDDSCGTFVMVNTDSLSYDNIIDGLLKGNFYTSTGPIIEELFVEGDEVTIKCSPAERISYSTRGRRAGVIFDEEGNLTEAKFSIRESDEYFRIDVIDKCGKRANTQAYFVNDLK